MEKPSSRTDVRLSTDEARQGETGHNVRYILGLSLVGAVLAVGVVYWAYLR